MSEFEYLNLLSSLRQEATVQTQFFVGVFSAFVLTTYFAGKKLSSIYLALLTVCYSLFIITPILASHVAVSQITSVAHQYASDYPNAMVEHTLIAQLPVLSTLLLLLCWLLSIFFMLSHRKNKATFS